MKHPIALVSALVLVLAALGFLVFTAAGPEELPPAGAPSLELSAPGRSDAGRATLLPFDEEFADGAPEPWERPAGLSRSEVAAEGERAGESRLALQVWDELEGVPAARAQVFVLDAGGTRGDRDPFAAHWSELPELRGRAHRTDASGRLTLPPLETWVLVSAHLPGKFGFARFGREHREVETITLVPDETIHVRVVDPRDQPVTDAGVAILQEIPRRPEPGPGEELERLERRIEDAKRWARQDPERSVQALAWIQGLHARRAQVEERMREERRERRRGRPEPDGEARPGRGDEPLVGRDVRARRRTDAAGVATFRHFQLFRQRAEPWWPAPVVDRFTCALGVPSERPIEETFAGAPVAERTITLHAPATGALVLRTVDRDGRPFRHPVQVVLRVRGTSSPEGLEARVRKTEDPEQVAFEHVPLGATFEARCRLDDGDFHWQVAAIAGPVEAGTTVVRDLVVAPDAGMLRGRVVLASGEPLPHVRPTFLINSEVGRLEGEDVTLDAEGRFHLPYLVEERHRGPYRLTLRLAAEAGMLGAERSLEELPLARVTELGDVRLDDLQGIAHGTVVDDRGEAVRGAWVQLQAERPTGAQDPTPRWVDEAFHATRTDDEGRYELLGALEPGRYRLRITARDHEAFHSQDLRVGERIDATLVRIARLVGTVLAPEWLADEGLFVRLCPSFATESLREESLRDLLGDGAKTFLFDRVGPGLYAVEFRVRQFPDPVLRLDGIEVVPGWNDVHPSLRDVDLRASLHRFEVRAMDATGQALEPDRPLLARIVRPDGSAAWIGFPWRDGALEIVSANPALEVVPLAMGHRAAPAVLAPGPNTLIFRALPPVDVAVPGMRALVGDTPVAIVMVPLDTSALPQQLVEWDRDSGRTARWYRWGQASSAELGAGDVARLHPMLDGRTRVMAHVGARGRGRRPVPVWLANVELQLVPGAAPQRLTLPVDPQAVQKALEQLAQAEAARAERERQRGR